MTTPRPKPKQKHEIEKIVFFFQEMSLYYSLYGYPNFYEYVLTLVSFETLSTFYQIFIQQFPSFTYTNVNYLQKGIFVYHYGEENISLSILPLNSSNTMINVKLEFIY